MKYSAKPLSQTVVQLCSEKGIHQIVISPGSRNAPLTIGFTKHNEMECFSIVDERCAAFVALGMAQQLQRPVALVCTSGSALLNYFPAVAEAFYSEVPLVVLSADRPAHLIDIGDGQTIQQEHVYGKHVIYTACCKEGKEVQLHNESEINTALNLAIELQRPVHINLPFSEPLYELVAETSVRPKNDPPKTWDIELDKSNLVDFIAEWNSAPKKMILIGVLPPNTLEEAWIERLGALEDTIVFTETTSNLHHPNFFPAIDQIISPLSEEEKKALQPDLLLTFGGMIVSKRIKALLRDYPPSKHWHVDERYARDTFFRLKHHIKTSPNTFMKKLLEKVKVYEASTYHAEWLEVKRYRLQQQEKFEATVPFSDFWVYREVFQHVPERSILQLANSTAIRYAQLFELDSSLAVFCNRGTSGIDGSTSTAIGAAMVTQKSVVLVTGDLSFFYDSNALWNQYIPNTFRIILVNNGGGGIFRILPNAQEIEHFEKYFETQHELTAESLCTMFGWGYHKASGKKALTETWMSFFKLSTQPQLLEIFTPDIKNDEVLKAYFSFIA